MGMMSLIGDARTWSVSWLKLLISLDLNILGNIWDNASTQVNKIYNTVLVVFGYFNPQSLTFYFICIILSFFFFFLNTGEAIWVQLTSQSSLLIPSCLHEILAVKKKCIKASQKCQNTHIHLLWYTVFLHGSEKLHYGNNLRWQHRDYVVTLQDKTQICITKTNKQQLDSSTIQVHNPKQRPSACRCVPCV